MENTNFLLSNLPTLQAINTSIDTAYSIQNSATPISVTVEKRFVPNATGDWTPVQGEAPATLKLVATEVRSFGGSKQNAIIRGYVTEEVTLPGNYQVDRGDFVSLTLCIGNDIGEIQSIVTPDGAAGTLKFEFESLSSDIPEFGRVDILVVPYACR